MEILKRKCRLILDDLLHVKIGNGLTGVYLEAMFILSSFRRCRCYKFSEKMMINDSRNSVKVLMIA